MKITQNFEWSSTKKKLVIFMPNYNGKALTEFSISRIKTVVPTDQWVIIIGNDGIDDSWEHLRVRNVASFTIHRNQREPRNGAFIRNYVIKNCQSELLLQKDGEVCVEGDFIFNAIQQCSAGISVGWRPGHAVALSPQDTQRYMQGILTNLEDISQEIEPVAPVKDIHKVKDYLLRKNGRVNFISYYHYAYCVDTAWLKTVHGYDEEYTHYGWEDVDMYLRLANKGLHIVPDYKCYAVHLAHPSTVNKPMLNVMGERFRIKDPAAWLRNPDGWGEGE